MPIHNRVRIIRIACLIGATLVCLTAQMRRAEASAGCAALNGTTNVNGTRTLGTGTGFQAGDKITLTITGLLQQLILSDTTNATTLGTAPPSPFTYVVPATTGDTFRVSLVSLANHPVSATWSCVSAPTSSTNTDSAKLQSLQISATPIVAQIWGQAVTGAIDSAIDDGFIGNPAPFTPNGGGFTYYFDADPQTQRSALDRDSLKEFFASPDGRSSRVADDFSALGYAGMATKAPPPAIAPARDWLAWIDVRGADFNDNRAGSDLKGEQVNAIAGLTRRLTPDFLVGLLGGYEHFNFSSQAFNGMLRGDGWTTGAYLGWRFAPHLRFDAAAAWSDILANDIAGSAAGNFIGSRWLISGGVTGAYRWRALFLEPSTRVFALSERENSYTDSLGTLQASRHFDTGRASSGVKVSYPFTWSSAMNLAPYAGLYGDYYFSHDDAMTAGLTTVPLLHGWSARATGGVAATFAGGSQLSAGGEYGGIGGAERIWTWRARGSVPF